MSESTIQSQIIRYLDSISAYSVKTISTNKRGCPDILCCYKGRFIGIEVKDTGKIKNLSPLQEFHISSINEQGGIAFVADKVETVKERLRGIK